MKRWPGLGSVTVTGPASRSKTDNEYRVSRFMRITICLSMGVWLRGYDGTCQDHPSLTEPPKYMSVSARLKLSGVTRAVSLTGACGPGCACASAGLMIATSRNPRRLNTKISHGLTILTEHSPYSLSSDLLDVRQLPHLVEWSGP